VIGGNEISEVSKTVSFFDVRDGLRVHGHTIEIRGFVDISGFFVPRILSGRSNI